MDAATVRLSTDWADRNSEHGSVEQGFTYESVHHATVSLYIESDTYRSRFFRLSSSNSLSKVSISLDFFFSPIIFFLA